MTSRWQDQLSMLRRVAFDSNALIYFLDDSEPYASLVAEAIAMMEEGRGVGVVSTVVEMEILVKPIRERDAGARDRAETFLRDRRNLFVRPVDRAVARRAADVRARTRLAPLDSMIASRLTGIQYLYLDDYVR